MARLRFSTKDVFPLLLHAKACSEWGMAYGHKGDPGPRLVLVKDEGIYLMSNGQPRQIDPQADGTRCIVAYATGHDPRNGNTWDKDREAAGGDDFGEWLPLDLFEEAIASGADHIVVSLTESKVSISWPSTPAAEETRKYLMTAMESRWIFFPPRCKTALGFPKSKMTPQQLDEYLMRKYAGKAVVLNRMPTEEAVVLYRKRFFGV